MTRALLIGLLVFVPCTASFAEEQTGVDLEARKASVANLETHIAQREARLAEWRQDIAELDGRIEKRVDELVKMLAGFTDSEQSRSRVSHLKRQSIEGLQNGIKLYVQKRKEVREKIRTGSTEALGDLDKFDERIIKRVGQITELAKSIPTHSDVEKYESSGRSYWNGYYDENSRITEEWRQNRRDSTQSDKQREDTTEALKASLERLDQRRRSLKDLLANRELTDAEKQLYTTELGQIDAYEDHLNAQVVDMVTATATSGGGTAIGREQAHDIELLIEDARKDLRQDVASMFRAYDQFVRGRAYIEGLKENLASRKEWLEKNAPK